MRFLASISEETSETAKVRSEVDQFGTTTQLAQRIRERNAHLFDSALTGEARVCTLFSDSELVSAAATVGIGSEHVSDSQSRSQQARGVSHVAEV